jgi:hypothetical protein
MLLQHVISYLRYKITLFQSPKRHTIPRLLTNTELTRRRKDYIHIALYSYYIFTQFYFNTIQFYQF